ncbi:hypothetical protein DP939_40470 [Spongiactinospora rosea]|uniref:Uncharacterized protein n=1 Tax=Spongiactinospora rosea TaxID=2248750 RepID=A0A366LKT2_9ACTN|nr:hypothetical protein [Spongiactinospora rosea]RBQ14536.1 hypothetical protein DP939_40470 [Spongiactinospora rosea]
MTFPVPEPPELRLLARLLVVYIAVLVALPVQMLLNGDAVARSIMRNNPSLDPAHLDFAVAGAHIYSGGLHALDIVLTLWLVLKLRKGRTWARVAFSGYLVFASLASLVSAAAGSEYLWAVIASDALHVVMFALLWWPRRVREYFAAARSKAS